MTQTKQLEVACIGYWSGICLYNGTSSDDGRLFDKLRAPADLANKSIIVNQKMVKEFDWKEPIGMTVTLYDTTKLTVIGVVKDFYS